MPQVELRAGDTVRFQHLNEDIVDQNNGLIAIVKEWDSDLDKQLTEFLFGPGAKRVYFPETDSNGVAFASELTLVWE